MKKRGFFFVALGLSAAISAYAANQNYTDLGTAQTITVTEDKLSDAQVNTGSYVTVITREQVEAYHAETLDKLLSKVPAVTCYTAGAIGSLSTPRVMGATANDTLIYIDGMQVNPVYSTFDLSTVPTSIIDHIEIIKAGSGNMHTVAAGGIINIVTKKATGDVENKFTITAENGYFLPWDYYNGATKIKDRRLSVDSTKLDLTYSDVFGKINLLLNAGGILARNNFTYTDSYYNKPVLNDNEFSDGHVNVIVNGTIADVTFQSNNTYSYQDYDTYGPQKTMVFNTSNSAKWEGFNFYADERYSQIEYDPNYHDAYSKYDKHQMNKLHFGTDYTFTFSKDISLKIAGDFTYDKMWDDELDEDYNRVVPKLSASSAIYLADGKVGLYPMVSLSLYSDLNGMDKFSTGDSLGVVWQALDNLELTGNVSYAETIPRFDQLHEDSHFYDSYYSLLYSYLSNEDLKKEKATNATIGVNYNLDKYLVSKTTVFAKYFRDLIAYDQKSATVNQLENIDKSAFFGLEEYLETTPFSTDNQKLTFWGSYLFNKSYNLSGDYDFSDDEPIYGNRTHVIKLGADYSWKMLTFAFDVAWNSEPENTNYDDPWIANIAVTAQVSKDLSFYGAIDNLFDKDYQSSSGLGMPGMKIRLGGSWKF